jgi:hypothetical protein
MHWVNRMQWNQLALITVLRPGDIKQAMGSKKIIVKTGHNFTLVTTGYHCLLETSHDDAIQWYAIVIRKAREDMHPTIRPLD